MQSPPSSIADINVITCAPGSPRPVIANAYRCDLLDAERLIGDALRFSSPRLNRRLGFFLDLFDIPGSEPLALRFGRSYAVPLAPGKTPAPGARPPVNNRWRVYEDPVIVGTALELK